MGLFSVGSSKRGSTPVTLKLEVDGRNYRSGQQVVLIDDSSNALHIALWCYGLPLLGLLLGASVGAPFEKGVSVLAGVAGLVAGICIAVYYFHRPATSSCLGQFRILACAN